MELCVCRLSRADTLGVVLKGRIERGMRQRDSREGEGRREGEREKGRNAKGGGGEAGRVRSKLLLLSCGAIPRKRERKRERERENKCPGLTAVYLEQALYFTMRPSVFQTPADPTFLQKSRVLISHFCSNSLHSSAKALHCCEDLIEIGRAHV